MFVWKASTILEKFESCFRDLRLSGKDRRCHEYGGGEAPGHRQIYPMIPSISIDYGILEKRSDVLVISREFGWN